MRLPGLTGTQRNSQMVIGLAGLNLTGTLMDGEWSWTQGCDTALAPVMRRREKRIKVAHLTKPNGIAALDKLAFADGTNFYWNGLCYAQDLADSRKLMVPMGSDIVIFPDKRIFSTVTMTMRPMEQSNTSSGTVSVALAAADGTPYGSYATGTEPANPTNGQLWLDTSETPVVMKRWSEAQGMWVDEYSTSVCVSAEGIGTGLRRDDAVTVSGLTDESLNGTWILLDAADDSITFTGIISAAFTQQTAVTASRTVPDMDFVVEHNNRLWGCAADSHEIYACALGDATNWRRYAGISTDSYAVTVGSPGPFTGAAVVNSSVCFFKEDCIHKIYGTAPSNFQMTVDHYRGVEKGSGASVVRVNELVFYKSTFDVCTYNGTEVSTISRELGVEGWHNAVSGRNDRRLYISMQDGNGDWQLLTYDTSTGYWMREDGTHALGFASVLTETFMLDAAGDIWALRSGEYAAGAYMIAPDGTHSYLVEATEETDAQVPWLLRTGELMARLQNNKRIGKIQILIDLPTGSTLTVRVKKDNEDWQEVFTKTSGAERRYTLPVYPRRCDRLTIELSGTGPFKLYNLAWMIEGGSEYGRA